MPFLCRALTLLTLLVALAACPRGTRKTLVPDVPQNGSTEARSRFVEARAKFLRDGRNVEEFRQIAEEFPEDPIVPWAELYAGMAAIKARQFEVAIKSLEGVVEANREAGLTLRAHLFLGIAKNYAGDAPGALRHLRQGASAVENDDERTEYLGALAYATAQSEQPLGSLAAFDELYRRVTPTERALIVTRVEEVVATADPDTLGRLFDQIADRKGPSIAAVASRLALVAENAGNTAEAARLREAASHARAAVGLPRTISSDATVGGGTGDPTLVGAVLPIGGKQQRVADAAIAGLGLAAGVSDGKAIAPVEIRSASDAASAELAVEDLARANVIAVVGPIDSASVDAAGARAEGLGVPLLSLSTAAEKNASSRFVFHMVHSGEARSRALAQRALAKGVKKFAVLAADNGYGRAMVGAFTDEVTRGGGTIVTTQTYKGDTKSFATFAAKLTGDWDAVFAPAQADVLGLIAPALAATGKIPRPLGTKKVLGGRPILLLSTAENLTAAYLTNAGRHSDGAFFAPGYYPDDQDPTSKDFLDRFISTFGRAPGFLEAYAYDAAQLAVAAGASGRVGLAAMLARGELPGLTGTIRFDAKHRRADPGVLYTVAEETGGVFAIRVSK
ncbi:MAG: Extracellular ligand-binding receptor [Myxococcales bacterium]|nr:Extracellular ligand-binding receptor [Myxococcales bacterium]